MHPKERIPTAAEAESINRKVTLIMSMAGASTDTAMTVLVYALAIRAVNDGVDIAEVSINLARIAATIKGETPC